MTIQILPQSARMALSEAGFPSAPIGPAPALRGTEFAMPGCSAEAGIWECAPGSFRRQVDRAEVMHLLQGDCVFTPDGGAPLALAAGDSLFFPAHTEGTWVISTTVRKLYVIV